MIVPDQDLYSVLRQYNPWWSGSQFPDRPQWKRAAFREISSWLYDPQNPRALLLSGARQVGKTTLFIQAIEDLLSKGIAPTNILYITFDHPLLKLVGLEKLLKLWREYEPIKDGLEYIFLDEIHFAKDWQTWIKHQVDFGRRRRIAFTGSATPITEKGQESGVGRWQTVRISTLSFYEYLQLNKIPDPKLPSISSLRDFFDWSPTQFAKLPDPAQELTGHFHEYLLRGGFPQTAQTPSIQTAQKLLREDIVDKVLKRDMTALFGVRRILELEQVFLYLCLHDGGILDVAGLCSNLQLKRPTVASFIDLLEATHLIYRLLPFGYGKQVLRAKPKIYLSDPAIAPSVLLKGKSLLEDSDGLARAVEAVFFKHVFARYYAQSVGFSYWHGKNGKEVDVVAQIENSVVPFEVKYRSHEHTQKKDLRGLIEFCAAQNVDRGYVITRESNDIGIIELAQSKILKIPAVLACYFLGKAELG